MKLFRCKLSVIITLFTTLLCPSINRASSLDLNFHDNTTRLTYASYTNKNVIADGGMLFISRNDSSEQMFHLGINKVSKNVRFGVRGIYTSPNDYDVLALGVGLHARFYLTRKINFDVGGYYAPEFASLMDAAGYTEIGLRLSFNITDPLDLYAGYRNIKIEIGDPGSKTEIDDDLHIGFKFYF